MLASWTRRRKTRRGTDGISWISTTPPRGSRPAWTAGAARPDGGGPTCPFVEARNLTEQLAPALGGLLYLASPSWDNQGGDPSL